MSRMLSGFDLIKLEEKLRNEVSEKFGSTAWDSKELVGSDAYEMDMRTARKIGYITISATQGPLDYFNGGDENLGRAIAQNSNGIIFCGFSL